MATSRGLKPLPEIEAVLAEVWQGLGRAGTWWLAAERLEMARQVREARTCRLCRRRKEALSPYAIDDEHKQAGPLAAAVVDAVHRLTTDPGRLSRRWYDALVTSGVRPEAVVEVIGVVAVVCFADTLAVALGRQHRELPAPQPGEPTHEVLNGLEEGYAWVPTVKPEAATGYVAEFYAPILQQSGIGQIPNIARALTAVPATMQDYLSLVHAAYPYQGGTDVLSQAQIELAGACASAINGCAY